MSLTESVISTGTRNEMSFRNIRNLQKQGVKQLFLLNTAINEHDKHSLTQLAMLCRGEYVPSVANQDSFSTDLANFFCWLSCFGDSTLAVLDRFRISSRRCLST